MLQKQELGNNLLILGNVVNAGNHNMRLRTAGMAEGRIVCFPTSVLLSKWDPLISPGIRQPTAARLDRETAPIQETEEPYPTGRDCGQLFSKLGF